MVDLSIVFCTFTRGYTWYFHIPIIFPMGGPNGLFKHRQGVYLEYLLKVYQVPPPFFRWIFLFFPWIFSFFPWIFSFFPWIFSFFPWIFQFFPWIFQFFPWIFQFFRNFPMDHGSPRPWPGESARHRPILRCRRALWRSAASARPLRPGPPGAAAGAGGTCFGGENHGKMLGKWWFDRDFDGISMGFMDNIMETWCVFWWNFKGLSWIHWSLWHANGNQYRVIMVICNLDIH